MKMIYLLRLLDLQWASAEEACTCLLHCGADEGYRDVERLTEDTPVIS